MAPHARSDSGARCPRAGVRSAAHANMGAGSRGPPLDATAESIGDTFLEALAFAEGRLLSIHPFADFNGRVTRVFLLELIPREGEETRAYLAALSAVDALDWTPLAEIWRRRLEAAASRRGLHARAPEPDGTGTYLRGGARPGDLSKAFRTRLAEYLPAPEPLAGNVGSVH